MPSIPKSMRAAVIESFGGPEVLRVRSVPVPDVDAGEVLIALDTAGVGSWDADIRRGEWVPTDDPQFPMVLGSDGAGKIVAAGSGVDRLKLDDRVYSYSLPNPKGGFYAEYVVVRAERVGHVPPSLDLAQAGAAATTGLTALQGIDDVLHLREGESILIHGASGAVGTLAVQFARLRGARVLAGASGAGGVELVLRLGADAAVDGRAGDLATAARSFAPRGLDAVLALVGGQALERALETLRRGGRLAYPNGIDPEPAPREGIETASYDAVAGVREFERLSEAIEAAKLRVPIAATYPLADAAKAHERLEQGHVLGRIALRVASGG